MFQASKALRERKALRAIRVLKVHRAFKAPTHLSPVLRDRKGLKDLLASKVIREK